MLRLAAMTLAICAASFATSADFAWKGTLAPGQTLEIKGVNGAIRVAETNAHEIDLKAERSGRRDDPNAVRIDVVPHELGVTICAVYPSRDPGKPNECKPGDAGRMTVQNNDVIVDFEVLLPRGLHLHAKTVNGAVQVRDISGDVQAHTVNGKIVVSAKGNVEAHTVNGSIQAAMGDTEWTGTRVFHTVNGGITLDLPASASAEVNAKVTNGDITSDFPLMVRGKIDRRRLNATIGRGGRELKLETVNGSIRIRRAS